MPIDRNTFNEAQRPLEDRILDILSENSDQAYSLAEIVVEIEEHSPQFISLMLVADNKLFNKYKDAIGALVLSGKIEKSEVKGTTYFAANK